MRKVKRKKDAKWGEVKAEGLAERGGNSGFFE